MTISELSSEMLAKLAQIRDDVIARAVTSAIGSGWTVESLTGRLSITTYPGVQVFTLDGINILELYDTRIESVTHGDSTKMTAIQGYRVLHSGASAEPSNDNYE